MLMQLEVKNFAIIEHSIIDFHEGFNVLSGETGAGKSIILDAMSSILGERTKKQVVRKGEEKAEIKAVFLKTNHIENRLKEKNILIEDDYLIIKRTITKSGRSVVKMNGSIQTTQVIKDICKELVEICGQREHQELLQENSYLPYLDDHGGTALQLQKKSYQASFQKWKEVTASLDELVSSDREKEQLLDLYRFQLEEIETANLVVGEEEQLDEEKKFLGGFEKISIGIQKANTHLTATDAIYEAKQELNALSKYDTSLTEWAEQLERLYYELDDIRQNVDTYLDHVEYDENRLNQVMYRLEDIKKIKRKYADTIEGVLAYQVEIADKVDMFDNQGDRIEALQKEKKQLESEMDLLADEMHETRIQLAVHEEKQILAELQALCMPNARLQFDLTKTDTFNVSGKTKVALLFNANKGEDMQSLAKIASGGELSRVLLAMKITNSEHEKIPTIFFDEVDEGVGGEVGRIIGNKLEKLGQTVQVITISHLPQVAARANRHFLIMKQTEQERTTSHVKLLTMEERKTEIARMIYGEEKNETTIKQAEEMLQKRK